MCMSFVAVGRSLTIVSYVAFKMAALWFWTMFNCNPPIAHCHPLIWGGGILVDHWSTISSLSFYFQVGIYLVIIYASGKPYVLCSHHCLWHMWCKRSAWYQQKSQMIRGQYVTIYYICLILHVHCIWYMHVCNICEFINNDFKCQTRLYPDIQAYFHHALWDQRQECILNLSMIMWSDGTSYFKDQVGSENIH